MKLERIGIYKVLVTGNKPFKLIEPVNGWGEISGRTKGNIRSLMVKRKEESDFLRKFFSDLGFVVSDPAPNFRFYFGLDIEVGADRDKLFFESLDILRSHGYKVLLRNTQYTYIIK